MPNFLRSPRLHTLVENVLPGETVADIGTDHALVPIAAVHSRRSPRAIGVDRAASALDAGRRKVEHFSLLDKISLRRGNGLAPLTPRDRVATVVMAGVGARTIIDAMRPDRLTALGAQRIVLQPNRSEISLREHIFCTPGWRLHDESLVEENGYFYVVFSVSLEPLAPAISLEDIALEDRLLGPHVRDRSPLLPPYAARMAELLVPHIAANEAHMPDHVLSRLQKRLAVFERAALAAR